MPVLTFPNCKINLGLYITEKRSDGYHNLETVFYPLPLNDVLEAVPAQSDVATIHMSGKAVAGNEKDNIVLKAYLLLQNRFAENIPALDIYLHKVIPMGAGLGGGSADGAFMLRLLNDMFALRLDDAALASLALQLGSDCPFFIYNTPQFAQGRGEVFTPVNLDLSACSLQLVCPKVHVSTAAAFKMLTPKPAAFDLRRLSTLAVSEWKDVVRNDFEAPVFAQHPELLKIKEQLYAAGAVYASMSGSGSALYGIFEKGKKAEGLKEETYFFE